MAANPDVVLRTWFEEVWNQGKEDTIDRLLAADGVSHGLPCGSAMKGPVDFKPFYHNFRAAFPDIRVDVVRTIAQDDMASGHCRVSGTHSGHIMGKAIGKPIEFSGMCMIRVRNGQIVEAWNNFDFLTLYQQLGLMPQLPA
jgi:steroid delta-isomerase-like uncharacterized protein